MSELHTNTTTDADKYVVNGVEVTAVEVIETITVFLKKQQFRVDILTARIAELEAEIDEIDALQARIANIEQANRGWCEQYSHELYENIKSAYRLAELSQALGLITTLKPTMVMDTDHPLDMAKEVEVYVTSRIAELEAAQRWIPVSERLPEDGEVVWFWDGYSMCMGYYLVYAGEFIDRDIPLRRIKPTHWMPLPTPPEVQE